MEKYFWREKNALKFSDKLKVWNPTREELEKELIQKFMQKLSRIDIIFDKNAREDYFKNDKKKKNNIENLSESEIQKKIGLQVVVDFLQLIKDCSVFFKIDLKKQVMYIENALSFDIIKNEIGMAILRLKNKKDIAKNLSKIKIRVFNLAKSLDIDLKNLEKLRQEKEDREGSFLLGKYVIW